MNDDVPWYVSLIIAWLPLIMFVLAVAWSTRRIQKSLTAGDDRSLAQIVGDLADEMKRANDRRL
ncbi:hypothetical protein [Bradyrhizobium sp. HKCCYLR1023]|uniref:hypothetical protein n=1 Tax=Bradyrhizobium TaxID=374 RepID=UPI003EB7FC59